MALLAGQVRNDITSIGTFQRTPQGGILAQCRPTRVGILKYTYPGGKVLREYRPAEEVFNQDSLATLAGAPLTVMHPKTDGGLVTTKTYRAETRGHIGDDVHTDGDFVATSARILDAETISDVEASKLKEMSCGYTADLDFTPGEFNGQPYDAIQRNIRYNHVALLPPGAGRAGRDVGLRLDGSAYTTDMVIRVDDETTLAQPAKEPVKVLDAKDFVPRADYDSLKGELTAAKSQLAEQKTKLDSAQAQVEPKNIDALVAKRMSLVTKAKSLVPAKTEFKTDGLSELEIMLAAIAAAKPGLKLDAEDSKSVDFVRGLFNGLTVETSAVKEAHGAVQEVVRQVGKQDAEDKDEDLGAKIRTESERRFQEGMKSQRSN